MKHVLAAIAFAVAAFNLSSHAHATTHLGGGVVRAAAGLAEGEIRKVDKEAKKLTIRHGPLQNLDMPAMTMVFQVKDTAMLDVVKAGDKVKFSADKVGGAYTVIHLEPLK